MAAKRKTLATRRPRRLMYATMLLSVAVVLMYLLLDGHVYNVTQGAEIGLYATIAVLFAGVTLTGSACYLALTSLIRGHRKLDNIVEIERPASLRKDRTKAQKKAA